MYYIVTNNPMVAKAQWKGMKTDYLENGTYPEVLNRVREYTHRHYSIVTHPLAGSIKPNQIPYRSVVVSDKPFDEEEYFQSCILIENCIETYNKFMACRPMPNWPEHFYKDFQLADFSLFRGAVKNMNSGNM